MGAFCCCPCGEDFDEYAHPNGSIYRHCICLRYFFHQLFNGYVLQRIEGRAAASPVQGATPLTSAGLGPSVDDSFSETHHLVPRPAPYDTDPRYSRLQRDGLVSRREKAMNHLQEDSQMLRRSSSSSGVEHLVGSGKKRNAADAEEECRTARSGSEKNLSTKGSYGAGYILATSEDEDVCPTCLDDYTPENPKIVTKCAHHFHLGCIYEWMERSESCPICGKEMEFCESP